MSSLKIRERFSLEAPPEVVWEYLANPERIVVCLPGASLDSAESDSTYLGRMKVKVGAVTVSYRGKMEFLELDHDLRRMRLAGKGRESTGSGSAKMTMESSVLALAGGGSEVTIDADVQIAGKIVRFGRGMIESVSQELFKQFTECLAEKVTQGDAHDATPPTSEARGPEGTPGNSETPEAEPLDAITLLLRVLSRKAKNLLRRILGDP